MIAIKNGGGNKPQPYDMSNGEYTDEQKKRFFEEEMGNIVTRYIYCVEDTFVPRYPVYNFHDDYYCKLYVKFCIKNPKINVPNNKIERYLLTPRINSDKSNLFIKKGYSKENYSVLQKNIIEGLDLSKITYNSLSQYCLKVEIISNVKSLIDNTVFPIRTIWKHDEKLNELSFVTAFPYKKKEEN